MSVKDFFNNKDSKVVKSKKSKNQINIPEGMFTKCECCEKTLVVEKVLEHSYTCYYCGHNFRMRAVDRINLICDENSFKAFNRTSKITNPLNFPSYEKKIFALKESTGLDEAVVTGFAKIGGVQSVVCVMDSHFLMGSMGSVVGEKITRAIEKATTLGLPLVIVCASGGARMQEGIISLMQMAKTSAALARFSKFGGLYISVLTDPTTGGVTASFAMLGDIIIAENDALIGFAGPRVIKQTIGDDLPEGFQKSEFLQEHGFVDIVVERADMKQTLEKVLRLHYDCN